jgi:transposase
MKTLIPDELLEPDHPARIIDKVVEMLDLSGMEDEYDEEGNIAYHVKMMVKVMFYAYFRSLYSSRQIWDGLKVRADFIFLSGDQLPNFRTINRFRTRHMDKLSGIFTQIVMMCKELGMIGFEEMAIDGQKIRANADWRKSKDKELLKKSYQEIKKGIKDLLAKEVNEDFTETKKKSRIKKLRKQEKKLKELQNVLDKIDDEDTKINMTDNDSKVMQHKDKRKLPSYNHQSAVDGKYGVTTAVNTKNKEDEPEDLFKLTDESNKNTKDRHKNIMADSAFCDLDRLKEAETKRKEDVYLPDKRFEAIERGKTKRGDYDLSKFRKKRGRIICPQGHRMKHIWTNDNFPDGHKQKLYEGTKCDTCEAREECISSKKPSYRRKIRIDSRSKYQERMRTKLRGDPGREIYIRRQAIVESVNGNDQKNKGWHQHYLRGLKKAGLEFLLMRIASNLGKMIKYRGKEIMAMA